MTGILADAHVNGFSAPFAQTYGDPCGRPVIYLHGTPGAPVEADIISSAARDAGVRLLALDRAAIAPNSSGDGYLSALATVVDDAGRHGPLPIIGFSIGAALALRLACRLGTRAGPLMLFSTAGPLDAPGAFEGMGGGAHIFRAAQKQGAAFNVAVGGQAFLAGLAPGLVSRLLFAEADVSDRDFARSAEGASALRKILRQSLSERSEAYRRDLTTYVEPWSDELTAIRTRVRMWHGAGDTWAPVAMAESVARRCAGDLSIGPTGHYTTLRAHIAHALAILD